MDSDEEADFDEIRRAQKLSFTMTNIISNVEAHRSVRIIYRGEYTRIAQTADEEHRRLRKYMVATDLSDESTHALEWAIGTVLRDGDTLIAIYCVDEETGIPEGDGISDDSKTTREQAAAVNTITSSKSAPGGLLFRGESTANTPGASPVPSIRGENKAEEDRHRAVKDITDRVLRLLRKTQLQVRVVVEVLHCKNPKHLITEVIDLVDPTLVVIGSRGRSALKGYVLNSTLSGCTRMMGSTNMFCCSVILGSFSNYLVTKSSVPVMVARKRLRKQSKYKRTPVRQVNNLHNPTARSLANAKID
jgi:nucleotide-binding universal stress UspA family protein